MTLYPHVMGNDGDDYLVYGGMVVGKDLFLVQHIRPGQYMFDPDGRCWLWNGVSRELTHMSWTELLSKEVEEGKI